jgi:hypothetical protein
MSNDHTANVARLLAIGVMRVNRCAASVISKSEPVPIRRDETDHAAHESAQADRVRTDREENQ